jgi:WD40 repeat protein
VYKGPEAPLTSIAIGGANNDIVFAGCWDKHIWSWKMDMGSWALLYEGHSDFVKAVACATVGGVPVLISGGADKKIIVWNVATGARIHVLSDPVQPMMAVQCLVVDPVESTPDELVLFSAGSDPHIRRWRITLGEAEKLRGPPDDKGVARETINVHETGVFRLQFDDDGDLWTASADNTVVCLSRHSGWTSVEATLSHSDCVRSVAVGRQFVATAGRAENVTIWDRASSELRYVLEGHFDEVTDLVILRDEKAGGKEKLVSVGIDGTIRTWPLDDDALRTVVQAVERAREREEVEGSKGDEGKQAKGAALTAEEEAELAELMDD